MALGMTPDEFWNKDPEYAVYYREADRQRTEKQNELLWLQGRYVYDALCAIAPFMRPMSKSPIKPYLSHPHPLSKEAVRREEDRHDKLVQAQGKAALSRLMSNMKQQEQVNGTGTA